jgi:uncharacterized protein (DUF342 family)
LESKYKAKIDESVAVLELYINKSVGIGEHPDIVEVLDNYMDMLESNTSKLESLQKLFSKPQATESN